MLICTFLPPPLRAILSYNKDMKDKNLDDRRSLIMSEIMSPDVVNFHGNVHGGHVLQLLDRVAYACASRYSGKLIVTLSVDEVVFKEPIYVGELLIFYANVNFVGTTSLEIGIRVVAENLLTSVQRHTNTCYFTMVALDENRKPTKIHPLTINNETEQRRFDEAVERKKNRMKRR
jgi:acyl-CoA hydrolase